MRYNYNCQVRNSSCRVFEQVRQPPPIPDDLYVKTDFENDLDWIIISQQNTGNREKKQRSLSWNNHSLQKKINCGVFPFIVLIGSHPHNDPDLAGAWAYLLNGYKWWVVFPNGQEME